VDIVVLTLHLCIPQNQLSRDITPLQSRTSRSSASVSKGWH